MAFDPIAYLDAKAGAKPAPPAFDPVAYLDSRKAAKKSEPAPTDKPSDPGFWKKAQGVGETALSMGTGAAGGLAGGLNFIGTLALSGGDVDAAKAVQQDTQEKLTYQPRSEAGQRISGNLGELLSLPSKAGEAMAEKNFDATGSPAWAATVQTVPDALVSALGIRGARGPLASAERGLENADAGLRTLADRANPLREVTPSTAMDSPQSMGAAAAARDLKNASPEIRALVDEANKSGAPIRQEILERVIEADSLPVRIKLTPGQATQDPVTISKEMNYRGKKDGAISRILQDQNQQLIENLDELRIRGSRDAIGHDPVQNGQALIDAYKSFDEPIRADISAKYKALEEANGGQFPLQGQDFVAAADAALAKKMKGRYVPKEVAGDLAEFRDGGPMTFENFENLRTNLAAEARKAERSGDGNAAAAVNIVREALESLPMTGEAAKIKPLADAARSAAKARFDKLRADPAYRAVVDDSVSAGEMSPLADDFIQKYVVKGKAANVKTMRDNLAADEFASQTIAAGALNYLKQKAGINLYTNEGNFSQAGYNRALAELTPKLGILVDPKLAEQVQALGNVARYTQVQPRGAFVNNSNTFTAAAADAAANTLEGAANVAAKGIPIGTLTRKALGNRADKKFAKETAEGVKLKDLLRPKKGPPD